MAYQIHNLRYYTVKRETKYFIDANVWLLILQPKANPTSENVAYTTAFENIARFNNNTKIVMTSCLLSEIINRAIRIHMSNYAKKQGHTLDDSYFKSVYRQSAQYPIDYETICDDIKSYHSSLLWLNDELNTYKFRDILSSPPKGLDFNDFMALKTISRNNCVLLTNDGDFWVEDVEVVTLNKALIGKMQLEVVRLAKDNK